MLAALSGASDTGGGLLRRGCGLGQSGMLKNPSVALAPFIAVDTLMLMRNTLPCTSAGARQCRKKD